METARQRGGACFGRICSNRGSGWEMGGEGLSIAAVLLLPVVALRSFIRSCSKLHKIDSNRLSMSQFIFLEHLG